MWEQSAAYPDPRIEALTPAFKKYHLPLSAVERLWTGSRWGEGPVWIGDLRCLLWSDTAGNVVRQWSEADGSVRDWQRPSNNANGHTRDRQGRILACEHLTRRVVRFEYDGAVTEIATQYDGRRLNSPNDIVVASDGAIWFSDPPFGIRGFYEGERAEPELPPNLYRVDPHGGAVQLVAEGIDHPNGLAFSPDERVLYVVESRSEPRNILAFDVDGVRLSNQRVLIRCAPEETPDGLRVDVDGNLWCGWGMAPGLDGVRVFTAQGEPIGHIHLPERAANLCFGGRHRNRLFITAAQSLYSLYVNTQGAPGG